ncbi:unnamed protein product [Parajaminaea phylloscopi]
MGPSANRPIPRDAAAVAGPAAQASSRTARRNIGSDQRGRDRANTVQQPPWQSSLDLVWSYSRSQAYYGHNLHTSPSFATDARWQGPQGGEEEDEDGYSDASDAEQTGYDDENESFDHSDANSFTAAEAGNWEEDTTVQGGANRWFSHLMPTSRRVSAAAKRDNRLASYGAGRPVTDGRDPEIRRRRSSGLFGSTPDPHDPRGADGRDQQDLTHTDESTPLLQSGPRRNSAVSSRRSSMRMRKTAGHTSALSGTSTFGQTLFNCVNALVGVGILSLPLALSLAGLPLGIALFVVAGLITNYTGKLLWKIMMHSGASQTLATYADIGRYAFGERSTFAVATLFCAELWAVSVALIVLFGDSVHALFQTSSSSGAFSAYMNGPAQWPAWTFKVLGLLLVLPTCFMPLRFLSPISLVGIFTTISIIVIVLTDGGMKHHSPGSLHQPAADALDLRPQWGKLPLAFGLIMSGFSSHPIIPSLVRDMRDPLLFPRMLNTAYVIATLLYLTMGIAGYLMFGRHVSDEITKDLAGIAEYPQALTKAAIALIATVSVTKFALALRPVQTIFESLILGKTASTAVAASTSAIDAEITAELSGGDGQATHSEQARVFGDADADADKLTGVPGQGTLSSLPSASPPTQTSSEQPTRRRASGSVFASEGEQDGSRLAHRGRYLGVWLVRLAVPLGVLITALIVPQFAEVMSFLGSVLAGLSCICGPIAAHLVVFGGGGDGTKAARRTVSFGEAGQQQQQQQHPSTSTSTPLRRQRRRPSSQSQSQSHAVAAEQGGDGIGGGGDVDVCLEEAIGPAVGAGSGRLSPLRRLAEMTAIALAGAMAVLGTVWAFLPTSSAFSAWS